MSNRKPGEKKDANGLKKEPSKHLVHMTKTLTRTDWGGQIPLEVVQRKIQNSGFQISPELAQVIVDICTEQVAGCRERTKPRFKEISDRLSKLELIQTAFNNIKTALG